MRKPKKTREGFLRADAYLARVGVQRYRRADGSEQLEFRPPEEVFKPDALESFGLAPITLEHPPRFVTSDNWRDFAVGDVGDNVVQDGDFVKASLIVRDPDAIRDLETGSRQEVSCGYTCDLDMKPGVYKDAAGKEHKYDCVQRNIVGNHVALVTRGRAGPEVRVRLDAEDALESTLSVARQEEDDTGRGRDKGDPPMGMVKHRIDGVDHEMSESAKQALEVQTGKNDALVASLKADVKAANEAREKAANEAAELKKKLDAAEKAKADAVDPEKVQALVKARVALCTQVQPILGDKVKLDEMSEQAIMVAVLQKADKDFKSDGKSEEYLKGRFDEALRLLKQKQVSPLERARGTVVMAGSHEDDDPLEKSLREYRQRNLRAAFKQDEKRE